MSDTTQLLFDLIHATGFDTYPQAMEFIKEAREVFTAADKTYPPMQPDEKKNFERAMLKAVAPDVDQRIADLERLNTQLVTDLNAALARVNELEARLLGRTTEDAM